MATLLIYLSDGFDGGETVFPALRGKDGKPMPPLMLKPPIGTGIVFYSYGPGWGGRKCNPGALHRSNAVTRGTKVVLQRWYSYLEHPFLAARAMQGGDAKKRKRLPFQPVVSCDYVEGAHTNVSCRWYNTDSVF